MTRVQQLVGELALDRAVAEKLPRVTLDEMPIPKQARVLAEQARTNALETGSEKRRMETEASIRAAAPTPGG